MPAVHIMLVDFDKYNGKYKSFEELVIKYYHAIL